MTTMSHPTDATDSTGDVLPCGTSVEVLVDQVDAGQLEPAGAHQAACPHCRDALRTAAGLDRALGLLRTTTGPTPAGLVDRVMDRVRQTQGEALLLELPPGPHSVGLARVAGGVRVRWQVVADLARGAAAALDGVTVTRASARARPGVSGAVDVSLGLLVDGRTPLPALARQLRQQVRAVLRRSLRADDVQVDLAALDLLDPD